MPRRKMAHETCRDCGKPVPSPKHFSVDVGSLFLGQSNVVCEDCQQARDNYDRKAEESILAAGCEIKHVPEEETDGWLGGLWVVVLGENEIGWSSYRKTAIHRAFNQISAP